MTTNRLQLPLLPEPRDGAQPLPPAARDQSIEIVARMLLQLVRREGARAAEVEDRDESR